MLLILLFLIAIYTRFQTFSVKLPAITRCDRWDRRTDHKVGPLTYGIMANTGTPERWKKMK